VFIEMFASPLRVQTARRQYLERLFIEMFASPSAAAHPPCMQAFYATLRAWQ
jgi:hypothetical protein